MSHSTGSTGLRVVGAAIVDDLERPTQLLAARRTAPSSLAGGWELPGGKVEEGEGAEEALHRELVEELGVAVRLGRELTTGDPSGVGWQTAWPMPDLPGRPRAGRLRVWLARVVEGVPEPLEEHDLLEWLPRERWLSIGWLPVDLPVVRRLLADTDPPGGTTAPGGGAAAGDAADVPADGPAPGGPPR